MMAHSPVDRGGGLDSPFAPRKVKAGFMELFRVHMPAMYLCRFKPSAEVLNNALGRRRSPTSTWEAIDTIISAVLNDVFDEMCFATALEGDMEVASQSLRRKYVETCRQILGIKSTCKMLNSL